MTNENGYLLPNLDDDRNFQKFLAKTELVCYYPEADIDGRTSHDMQPIEVQFATRRVAEKIEGRGLTLDDCIEILENAP